MFVKTRLRCTCLTFSKVLNMYTLSVRITRTDNIDVKYYLTLHITHLLKSTKLYKTFPLPLKHEHFCVGSPSEVLTNESQKVSSVKVKCLTRFLLITRVMSHVLNEEFLSHALINIMNRGTLPRGC